MYALKRTAAAISKQGHQPVASLGWTTKAMKGYNGFIATKRRDIHTVRPLPYDIDEGLEGFLSPEALKIIGEEYQQGLLQRLNEEVAGTALENLSVAQTIVSAANSQEHILAWNYASQALNNSFFFDNLLPLSRAPASTNNPNPISHEHAISTTLLSLVDQSFGSLEGLKSTLSAAACGLMGSGWIWLVTDSSAQHLAFVASYGPGTLLVRSRQHRHPEGLTGSPMPRGWDGMGVRPTGKDDLFRVLGESLSNTSESNTNGHAMPPEQSILGRKPSEKRGFHHSSGSLAPLPWSLIESLRAQPRALSPPTLSASLAVRYSTMRKEEEEVEDEGSSESLEKDLDDFIPDEPTIPSRKQPASAADRLLGSKPQGPSGLLSSVGERANVQWDKNRLRMGADDISPLLCISVHEHMWLLGGYGIWGKEEYLKRFWTVVDWGKVSRTLELWAANAPRK